MVKTTKQCCSGDCVQGRWCENKAWEKYVQARNRKLKAMITRPSFIVGVCVVVAIIIAL